MKVKDLVSGALFDFAGYLTARKNPITLGASCESTQVIKCLEDWADNRGIPLQGCESRVKDWEDYANTEIA